jgi:hypothetical protein
MDLLGGSQPDSETLPAASTNGVTSSAHRVPGTARVIWALVARNQAYDVNRMLDQIQMHHSDLWKEFVRLHQADRALWKKVDSKFKKIV